MAVKSPCPDVVIPETTLHAFVFNKIKCYGERVAFIDDGTGRTLTYNSFIVAANKVAQSFHAVGLQKNDVVAIGLPNSMEYAVLIYGIMLAGGTVAGINPILHEREVKDILHNAVPRYFFTLPELYERIEFVLDTCPKLQETFITQGKIAGLRSYDDFLELGIENSPPTIPFNPENDVAILTYTSGSTGKRKGVMLTHYNLVANILQMRSPLISVYTGNDVLLAIRPATHAYGILMNYTTGLYEGCTNVFLKNTDPESLSRAIEKYKVSLLTFTPLNLAELSRFTDISKYDYSSVKTVISAGAPLNPLVLDRFKKTLNIDDVRDTFGMSEALFAMMPKITDKGSGVGVLLPNFEAKVIDITSRECLGAGENGELWLKSPSIFKGYKDRPTEQANVYIDGWFDTGDVVYFDNSFNFYVVDRTKDLILYDSAKVAPRELDDFILTITGVSEVAVAGIPDEDYHELAKAFVVRESGSTVTENDIINAVKEAFQKRKWLHGGVEFVDSLPKGPTGKVLRRRLRETSQS